MGLIIKNNVIYNGAESEPVVYSLDEREVGVWTDGKPLYQKTILISNPLTGDNEYNLGVNNINTIVSQWGTWTRDLGNGLIWTYDLNAVNEIAFDTQFIVICRARESSNKLYVYIASGAYTNAVAGIRYTMQYTKTTDTPGSGTWTPSGVKTVHYSENEQVVGTWTDGSTLYEKSYTIPQTSSAYTIFNFTGLNISEVTNVYTHEGIAFAPSTSETPHGSAPLSGYTQSSAGELGFVGYVTHDANTGMYQLHYRVGSYLSGGTARVTVRYNKITS